MNGATPDVVPPPEDPALRIGVLAFQGDFAAHCQALRSLGAIAAEVRAAEQLAELDGLVIPGGESTTIMKAIDRDGLGPGIRAHVRAGKPVLGTCAGMIVVDSNHLGLIDAVARRNAFGRQLQSFESDLVLSDGIGPEPIHVAFIRAPWIESAGEGVEILASWDGRPVAIREGPVLACAFHPELAGDSRIHALLMAMAAAATRAPVTRKE